MNFGLGKRAPMIAVDIAPDHVSLCEIQGDLQLVRFLSQDIDSTKTDNAMAQVIALTELLKLGQIESCRVIFALPNRSVFIRNRTLPVDKAKLDKMVAISLAHDMPFRLDEIYSDYHVVGNIDMQAKVLLAAVNKGAAQLYAQPLLSAGCQVEIADVRPIAIYNWLKFTSQLYNVTPDESLNHRTVMLNIEENETDVVIQNREEIELVRSIHVGSKNLPNLFTQLVNEIKRSIGYVSSQSGIINAAKIVITGRGAEIPTLETELAKALELEVKTAEPIGGLYIGKMAKDVDVHPQRAYAALGMALRAHHPDRVPIKLNLWKPTAKPRQTELKVLSFLKEVLDKRIAAIK